VEQTVKKATGIVSRAVAAIAERIENMITGVADFFLPPPPPTKEQAEGVQRADRGTARAERRGRTAVGERGVRRLAGI
jgi:hypothetical protein